MAIPNSKQQPNAEAERIKAKLREMEQAGQTPKPQPQAQPQAQPQPQPEPKPEPAPAPAPTSAPRLGADFDRDLLAKIRRLSPEQRAKVQRVGASEGIISAHSALATSRTKPDGSVDVLITVDADLVEQLRTWSQEAGLSFEEQTREIISMLLNSYLSGGWMVPMAPMPAAQAGGGQAAAGGGATQTTAK
jgi:predicted component of type VI protein secretion system